MFDEFARMVAPTIHLAGGVNVHIDPAITSEFANVVYRFGHSMLDENVNLYVLGADGKPVIGANGQPQMTQDGLIQAFTNPALFANGVGTVGVGGSVGTAANSAMTADIILGTVNQVGNEIDEFVTGTLQNNLLGLPLDLASLNIARGRDTGVAPLNLARAQLFAVSGEQQLKPYISWVDFGSELKHIESLVELHCRLRHTCQPHHRGRNQRPEDGRRAGAGRRRNARQLNVQHRRLQLPEQPGRLRQQQDRRRAPPTTPPVRWRPGAPAPSPVWTRSTCGSAAWPRSRA